MVRSVGAGEHPLHGKPVFSLAWVRYGMGAFLDHHCVLEERYSSAPADKTNDIYFSMCCMQDLPVIADPVAVIAFREPL